MCACVYTYIYIYIYIYIYTHSHTQTDLSLSLSIYIYIYICYHHHHIALVARISLTLSRHSSLSFIALGRSSGKHPVSSYSCWMYVRAGRPAFSRPCVVVMSLAQISLTPSHHISLPFIASGRTSGLHPVSSHSCCMYVQAGRPAFALPYVGVHRNTSLMSSSLLLQWYPACLVRLTWIVFVIGGRWRYCWCLIYLLINLMYKPLIP